MANAQVHVYRTRDGRTFSEAQRDSLHFDGHRLTDGSVVERNDSVIHFVYFNDKTLFMTAFQKRFTDKPLKHFALKSIQHGMIDSEKLAGAKLIYIWKDSPGTPRCIRQWNELAEKYQGRATVIFLTPDSLHFALRAIKQLTLKMPVVADAFDFISRDDLEAFGAVFFVDRNGIIRYVSEGVPVKNVDGAIVEEGDDFEYAIVERYSVMIDKLLTK